MIIGCAMAGGSSFLRGLFAAGGAGLYHSRKSRFYHRALRGDCADLGLFIKQKTGLGMWVGAVIAAWGMYLLSVTEALTIATGDLLVLSGCRFLGDSCADHQLALA